MYAHYVLDLLKNRVEWKIAVKTGLAGGLGLFAGITLSKVFARPDTMISGLWTAVAAIVVQQTHLGSTYRSAWNRFLGVFIGCLMGGLFTSLFGSNPFSVAVSIFLTIVCCSLINIKDSVRIACLSVAVVMVLWGLRPMTSPWVFGFFRFVDSCVGILVAIVVAHLFWPSQISKTAGANVSQIFRHLADMYRFAVNLSQPTEIQLISFKGLVNETDDLLWKNRQFLDDSKLELLENYTGLDEWQLLFWHLDLIFETLITMSRLPKTHLEQMLDKDLSDRLRRIISETNEVFYHFSQGMETGGVKLDFTKMKKECEQLNNELARFRSTKSTRNYELQDVEAFFVYFYIIRVLADELQKTGKHIHNLINFNAG